jgi:MoaA/NifB/PqqE/SkfB family radical SAM enzyme
MDCARSIFFNDAQYLELFHKKLEEERIPFSGSIDITQRCNLRCIHCYLGQHTCSPVNRQRELKTDQILSLLDEITKAGCLFLLITGGEPLFRKDFPKIYMHAKRNGLIPTVFTNGTLIKDSIAELFGEYPPYSVEVSLYGATASTYEIITGVKGSYARCMKGIQILLRNKINVQLKTVLMILNSHELSAMEDMAKNFGVKFRFDAALFACLNGDETPLSLRVSPEEAVEKEFSDPARYRDWQEYARRHKDVYVEENLYICGAGLSNFHIDPYGNLQPCLMTHAIQYNLLDGNFLSGWYNIYDRIGQKKVREDFLCRECEKVAFCNYCPAFCLLENGKEGLRSEYLCSIGSLRHARLSLTNSEG